MTHLERSVKILQRRLLYLTDRVEQFEQRGIPGASYAHAEIAALKHVIEYVQAALAKEQKEQEKNAAKPPPSLPLPTPRPELGELPPV